jgi:hypothetical protein
LRLLHIDEQRMMLRFRGVKVDERTTRIYLFHRNERICD